MNVIDLGFIRVVYACFANEGETIGGYSLSQLGAMDTNGNDRVAFDEFRAFENSRGRKMTPHNLEGTFSSILKEAGSLFNNGKFSEKNTSCRLKTGALELDIHVSTTANLFYVVDELSKWDIFCDEQYLQYFERLPDGLSETDRHFLELHRQIRGMHGWGGGLEQTFYSPLELREALEVGVRNGHLTREEADIERKVLEHFRERIERIMAETMPAQSDLVRTVISRRDQLTQTAGAFSHFVGGADIFVPVYLLANPDMDSTDGGFNGGRLTLATTTADRTYNVLLHESLHAFLDLKDGEIKRAAESVGDKQFGTQVFKEGIAYAFSPGLTGNSGGDKLRRDAERKVREDVRRERPYVWYNVFALAIRPLLKKALDNRQPIEEFLPEAAKAWSRVPEIMKELED